MALDNTSEWTRAVTYSDHIVLPHAQRLALYADTTAVIDRHGGSIEIPYVAMLFLAFRR